jgi:zinc protease
LNHARELVRPSPGGGRSGGLPEHVRAITPAEVRARWERYYRPRNAILALAGAVDAGPARKAVEAHFGPLAAGEEAPAPREHGAPKLGAVRELTVQPALPDVEPTACLAYAAPRPDSELYAPFLVLASRLWAGAARLGGDPFLPPVHYAPLDDPEIVAVSAPARPGEAAAKAFARLEAFVAETLGPKLRDSELASVRQEFGPFLGLAEPPDAILAMNPYGVAFALARCEQLGIDPARLNRALEAITDRDLRRVAGELFAPKRHAGAFIALEK